MKKQWISLFAMSDGLKLEENLNDFINKYNVTEIKIIIRNDIWYASVRYEFPEAPIYYKPEKDDE